jgi:hypothetical protein
MSAEKRSIEPTSVRLRRTRNAPAIILTSENHLRSFDFYRRLAFAIATLLAVLVFRRRSAYQISINSVAAASAKSDKAQYLQQQQHTASACAPSRCYPTIP